ncbi:MAG: transcriptional regulator [Rhizobium sp.]|nr:transcriptional regulator [Rhizobium sp.]
MSKVGDDLVEAFQEMAAYLRGDVEVESYVVPDDVLTPQKISEIRKRVASSTKVFERDFMIPARTMESYEQGRRKPDTATVALLKIIERAPDVARAALASNHR